MSSVNGKGKKKLIGICAMCLCALASQVFIGFHLPYGHLNIISYIKSDPWYFLSC